MKRIMIAGAYSGVGKTTICAGIMAALTKRKINVAPFKTGPDYIDTAFHKFVTGNPSYNLDSWLLDEQTIRYLFNKNSNNKEIAIIEGVMGLYDGLGIEKDQGSSAYLSKILKSPVILVIDGRGISTSAAAQVMGYKNFDEDVNIQGVIVNNISGKKHYELIKDAIYKYTGIRCVGYLPQNKNISFESRHLGLVQAEEINDLKSKINQLSKMIEDNIDLDAILKISEDTTSIKTQNDKYSKYKNLYKGLRIGVARDKAFSFYYEDNLDLLKELGFELIFFSPITDDHLPNVDGLYIGGGYPEVYAKELEKNLSFRKELKKKLENGMPAYAECGGLIYLTESVKDLNNNVYEMTGFLPAKSMMTNKLQRFGYVNVKNSDRINIEAHEFHRSLIEENDKLSYEYDVTKLKEGKVIKQWVCGVRKNNVLAGYPHIHFYSNIDFLLNYIDKYIKKNRGVLFG